MGLTHLLLTSLAAVALLTLASTPAPSDPMACLTDSAPFINTWLVIGTYGNDKSNSGYDKDYIGEADAQPVEGADAGGRVWRYFDDRLFSRNYDDYQDLFSYFKVKRNESVAAKVAYAHAYIFSVVPQSGQLRFGADNEFKAWLNGKLVASSTESKPHRDMVRADVSLTKGWNRLLVKIANQEDGRFGFYARVCGPDGMPIPGLIYSTADGHGKLAVCTKEMSDIGSGNTPKAFTEWPYVGADVESGVSPKLLPYLRLKPEFMMHGSPFFLSASGGSPPYRWALADGKLPAGLTIDKNGAVIGTVARTARPGKYAFRVSVTDSAGGVAARDLDMTVSIRPNRWYETAKLVALMHRPESLVDSEIPKLAALMKKQGYGCGMIISYNNGDFKYRWPSIFEPNNPLGDVVGKYKAALEAQGIKFGMYMGNIIGPNHGGDNGGILMVEDAMRRYKPAALWFDWLSPDVNGYMSLDALYSMVRSISPETVIVINGTHTLHNGDWDAVCLEGWGAWGNYKWAVWPEPIKWAKKVPEESWRLVVDRGFQKKMTPAVTGHDDQFDLDCDREWQDYLKVQLSIIGEGQVANIDHTGTLEDGLNADGKLTSLEGSFIYQVHKKMAEWENPAGVPSLVESYTQVDRGPLSDAPWGYNTINLPRTAIYIHMMKNEIGKTGVPSGGRLIVGPMRVKVRRVVWMNKNADLHFNQDKSDLVIGLEPLAADPVDTILKIELERAYPWVESNAVERDRKPKPKPTPPGNLATGKPARLLSNDGKRELVPSGVNEASFGVDADPNTCAQGGGDWAWTYQVDLQAIHSLTRLVTHFLKTSYATDFKVLLSADGQSWAEIAHIVDNKEMDHEFSIDKTAARYIRIQSLKPDGPNQPGGQMAIAELEAYD
jgi:hypothetical protein